MNSRSHRQRRPLFHGRFFDYLIGLLRIPAPDTPQLLRRIQKVERDIVLPVKAAGIAMLLFSFYSSPWTQIVLSSLDIAIESTQYFLWLYIAFNCMAAIVLFAMRKLPLVQVEWTVFTSS